MSLLDRMYTQYLKNRGFIKAAERLQTALVAETKSLLASLDTTKTQSTPPAVASTSLPIREPYEQLREWVDASLDAFKSELRQLLFPLFVHTYLGLVEVSDRKTALAFLHARQEEHALVNQQELSYLSKVTSVDHLQTNLYVRHVRSQRFEVPLCGYSRALLLHFLQAAASAAASACTSHTARTSTQ